MAVEITLTLSSVPICVMLTACLMASAVSCQAAERFVSTEGNDAWSGTLPAPNADGTDGPFATLSRAREAVRELRAAAPDEPVTVTVRGGTYYLGEPLVLSGADSGASGAPVRWQAHPDETVVLSGGRPITGPWQPGEGETFVTRVPEVADGEWYFRLLRVGEEWAIRARYPNYDPEHPYTGGWLFVKPSSRIEGQFGKAVGNIHNRGDMMQWTVEIPATGDYNVFHYYAAENEPWGRTDMGGRVAFTVDDGEPVVLQNLQDTGSFRTFRWSDVNATVRLEEGTHTIRWVNQQGGGINYDAFALCDDPDWRPQGTPPQPPEHGHLVVVHAETFEESRGEELSVSLPASRRHFGFDPDEIPMWEAAEEIEMHVFPAWGWVSSIEPVAELDHETGLGTLAGREANQELRVGNRYYLENILEELDMPGEWYLERDTGLLHYWPREEDFAQREIVAPVHDRIIHIRPDEQGPAQHIEIAGFTFMDTGYTPRIETPYYPPDAAIWIEDSHQCLVEGCRFTRLGGSALNLVGDAHHNRFLECTVEHVGQNGVFMRPTEDSAPTQNTVAGCHMHHLGLIYKHVAGVYIGSRPPAMAQEPGNLIARNLITDVPRYAIGIKMNQGNNVVEYNRIHRTNLETNDTGGIESCVRNREAAGNTIRYNLVMDTIGLKTTTDGQILTPYYTWGIYLDDHSSHAHVVGNICVRNWRGGVVVHGGQRNVIENNILVGSELGQAEFNNIRGQMVQNVFRRNVCCRLGEGGAMLRSNGFNEDVLAECDGNLYWSTADPPEALTFVGKSLEQWRELGYDEHSVVAEPGFADPEADDFTLAADSPAFELGFQAIPVERIGLAGYDRESYAP